MKQVAVQEGEDRGKAKVEASNRFNEITQQLSALSTNLSNNALDATAAYKVLINNKEGLAGMPDRFLAQAAQKVRASHGLISPCPAPEQPLMCT